MAAFVIAQNIARFRQLLQSTQDEQQRRILTRLLEEEEAKDRQYGRAADRTEQDRR